MSDIDCDREMQAFHKEKVTLAATQQKDMRERRDNGRTRLENGLTEAEHPQPFEIRSQGSYQMRTMVQDPDNDYDIDDGAYFEQDALLDAEGNALTPLAARQRVCDALKWDGRLKHEAEVRSNCVRQEYPAGYHIDIPVYRIVSTTAPNGDETEHFELASSDKWVESDAREVTRWFNNTVGELNQGESDGSQMRRVTKLSKKFARRSDWKEKTTSGICITKLVVDHFSVSDGRDDLALRNTWIAIESKLRNSTKLKHPVNTANLAEAGDEKLTFFRDCLSDALKTLDALDKAGVTRKEARQAWDDVFDTEFFTDQPDDNDNDGGDRGSGGDGPKGKGPILSVTSGETARRNDGGGRFG
jgi:hypothetical protein